MYEINFARRHDHYQVESYPGKNSGSGSLRANGTGFRFPALLFIYNDCLFSYKECLFNVSSHITT